MREQLQQQSASSGFDDASAAASHYRGRTLAGGSAAASAIAVGFKSQPLDSTAYDIAKGRLKHLQLLALAAGPAVGHSGGSSVGGYTSVAAGEELLLRALQQPEDTARMHR